MILKYNTYIENEAIKANLKRLTNQIYKLLPTWEEALDWHKPLATIIEEIAGMDRLFLDHHKILFSLLCKLEGLFIYSNEEDFYYDHYDDFFDYYDAEDYYNEHND